MVCTDSQAQVYARSCFGSDPKLSNPSAKFGIRSEICGSDPKFAAPIRNLRIRFKICGSELLMLIDLWVINGLHRLSSSGIRSLMLKICPKFAIPDSQFLIETYNDITTWNL